MLDSVIQTETAHKKEVGLGYSILIVIQIELHKKERKKKRGWTRLY